MNSSGLKTYWKNEHLKLFDTVKLAIIKIER